MDSDQSKLFVGGISRETSEETLRDHFSKYGGISSSVVARERNTRTPRGFGFVCFSDPLSAEEALKVTHTILGRTVEVKKAIPRREQHQNQLPYESQSSLLSENSSDGDINNHVRTKKIFVGGLPSDLTEEEFKNYFMTFGTITDVVVMHDNVTNRPRGFGFVTFDSEESVEKVILKTFHKLNGKLVEVKQAVPKEEINNGGSNCDYNIRGGGVGKGFSYNGYESGYGYGYPYGYSSVYVIPGYNGVGGYIPGAGMFGTGPGYPMVPYRKFGYGSTSIHPRSSWYGPGAGAGPLLYGNVIPAYMIGGAGGYNGIVNGGVNGKLNQVLGGNGHPLPNATIPSRTEDATRTEDAALSQTKEDAAPSQTTPSQTDEDATLSVLSQTDEDATRSQTDEDAIPSPAEDTTPSQAEDAIPSLAEEDATPSQLADPVPSQPKEVKLDVDSTGLKESDDTASGEENQKDVDRGINLRL